MPKQFKLPGATRLPQGWLMQYWSRAGGVVHRVCPHQPQATERVLVGATLAQRRQVPEWMRAEGIAQRQLVRSKSLLAGMLALTVGTIGHTRLL